MSNISFDRKILNQHNTVIDDPFDKVLATPAQVKRVGQRGKKALRKFWKQDVQDQLNETKE